MSIIVTQHCSVRYSLGTPFEKEALSDVCVDIREGELLGIIGHTGSGKSSFVQLLNGLMKPHEGTVLLDGRDIWKEPKEIRKIRFQVGMVFQYPEYQLFEETVYKDIAFGPRNMGLSEEEIHARVLRAAERVGLDSALLEKSPFELSGGEKRRAAIAGVMAMEPRVLILDEPTAGLDPRGRERILKMIRQYQRENHTTVLLVSHSMEDIARVADRVLVLDHGHVAMLESVETIFSHAEELERMGLSVPAVTKVFNRLREAGVPVSNAVYTTEQAEEEWRRLFWGGVSDVV